MKYDTVDAYVARNTDGKESDKYATINDEADMTQQSDADETDINLIVKKFGVTGQVNGVLQPALYGDFTSVGNYRDALDMVRAADEAFLELPAKVREDFDNDPAKFMDFAQDEKNFDKLREYGLAKPKEIEEPPKPANQPTEAPK